jgi:type III secretion system HrpE/YscL family protein
MAGKIIKGEALPAPDAERLSVPVRPRAAVVDSNVYEAHQQAKQIVEQANAEAARIRDSAERERVKVLEKAKGEGYQAGLAQASEILAKAHRQRGEMVAAAELELVKLAVKVGEKIIGRELSQDREAIVTICAQACENLRAQGELVFRVNPEDAAILRKSLPRLLERIGRTKDVSVRDDPEVARGGCIIQSGSGATFDAQLATQLEMIQRALLGDEGAESGAKTGVKS